MRLWTDCLNTETKVGATTACGNVNLCAGLWAGIEGNLHAVNAMVGSDGVAAGYGRHINGCH